MDQVNERLAALVAAVEERHEQTGGWSFLPSGDDGAVQACLLAVAADRGFVEFTPDALENVIEAGERVLEPVHEGDDTVEVDE